MVSNEQNLSLIAMRFQGEIEDVIKEMNLLKAPGPDGLLGSSYCSYWTTVKNDVYTIASDFFITGCLPRALNSTNIVLIPKTHSPCCVSEYHPISICNFTYKIIFKILANYLKPILLELISPLQTTFVNGRNIQENSLITHEIVNTMSKKRGN